MKALVEMFMAHKHSREEWNPTQALLGRDRRVFDRLPVKIPCRMDNQVFGLESEGQAVNLSLGGVGVVAPVNWPEGSTVRVYVGELILTGLIVYRRDSTATNQDFRYGIKFQKLGIFDLLKLRKMIKESPPQKSEENI